MFRQANRDRFVIFLLGHVYTVVSPDGTKAMEFQDHLPASSGIRRHMVNELRDWLAHTRNSDREGQGDGGLQNLDQGDRHRRGAKADGGQRLGRSEAS